MKEDKYNIVTDEYHKLVPKEDLILIQEAIHEERGILFTLDECGDIWQNYSWSLAASWLFLPKKEDIVGFIESSDTFESFFEWAYMEGKGFKRKT